MFAPLPLGFPQLRQVVDTMGAVRIAAPPEMMHIGRRMRQLYARARLDGYRGLSRGQIRRLPYAMWLPDEPCLDRVEPDLVRAYWETHLPAAVQHPRVAKRWLAPLFYVYGHEFRRSDHDFRAFAVRLQVALKDAQGPVATWLSELQAKYRWFSPDDVGPQLGRALLQTSRSMAEILADMKLWAGVLDEPLLEEAFKGALRVPDAALSLEAVIERIQSWACSDVAVRGVRGARHILRYPAARVALAEGLVRPWLRAQPSDQLRNALSSFLIRHYGDPRMLSAGHAGHNWQGVSELTVSTVKRWLVGDTLRGFMRILQLTADDIWRYRQRFWMAYYDRGVVEEAWLALGAQAAWQAKREFGKMEWSPYGTLVSGAAASQSVLFLRIGQIVFMEWSHNGSLRACLNDDPRLPALYQPEYRGEQLRDVVSLDFHNGINERPQLTHANSEGGTWQRKARDFIADQTGVRLSDQAILD
jgi:hypothetical protein